MTNPPALSSFPRRPRRANLLPSTPTGASFRAPFEIGINVGFIHTVPFLFLKQKIVKTIKLSRSNSLYSCTHICTTSGQTSGRRNTASSRDSRTGIPCPQERWSCCRKPSPTFGQSSWRKSRRWCAFWGGTFCSRNTCRRSAWPRRCWGWLWSCRGRLLPPPCL